MENPSKRNRDVFLKNLESNYVSRQKENELDLFENIKSDISAIFTEQLRKRSKAEFELSNIEKKFLYLKRLYEGTQKLLKKEQVDVRNETDLIRHYFEYTTTNLDYAFIKYESIIGNLTKTNEEIKKEVQYVKEKELQEFKDGYAALKEQITLLQHLRIDVIEKKNSIKDLEEEYISVVQLTEEKSAEHKLVEQQYTQLVQEQEDFMKQFMKIKEECTNQMNVKKASASEIKELESRIEDLEDSMQQLLEQKKTVTTELKTIQEQKETVLGKLVHSNKELETQCDQLTKEIELIEKETSIMIQKIESMKKHCEKLENQLKNIINTCENKKKEDLELNSILKEKTNDFMKSKMNLKEMEDHMSIFQNEYGLLQTENQQSEQTIGSLHQNIITLETKIKECTERIDAQKQEMIDLKEKQKSNEKERLELENTIFCLEQTLQEQKSFYFQVSKYVNMIVMCNEEYQKLKNQNMYEQNDSYTKSYEELEKTLENLFHENKEKEETHLQVIKEVGQIEKRIQDNEEDTLSISTEHNKLKEALETIKETIKSSVKKLEEMKKIVEQKIKEAEEIHQIRYDKAQDYFKSEKKLKQQEHDSFLKKAEKEKLECAFHVFQSELKINKEKQIKELKNKLIEVKNELKINEETYNKLKVKP